MKARKEPPTSEKEILLVEDSPMQARIISHAKNGVDRFAMARQIGEWVLRTACCQTKEWQEEGFPALRIAVNLSSRQYKQETLLQRLTQALDEIGFDPHLLDLKLTESIFMEGTTSTVNTLRELNLLGVQFSIDDFGTGYSALSYIKRFPINRLKIDRSFVSSMTSDQNDAEIVRTIVGLGHNLDLKAIAEGVEHARASHSRPLGRGLDARIQIDSSPFGSKIPRCLRRGIFKPPSSLRSCARSIATRCRAISSVGPCRWKMRSAC